MLGSNFKNPSDYWTKVTEIDVVNLSVIYRHIFVFISDGFIVYKYQDRLMPNLLNIKKKFFVDFINYFIINDLINLLGLQVLINNID